MKKLKNVGVFCSASNALESHYYDLSDKFGKILVQKQLNLVYGGASIGMMGSVANACLNSNSKVIGVIPKVILEREVAHPKLDELIITEDMHERKKMIYEHSDIIAVLPGGFGTLDEACEFMTWNQLGIHQKKLAFISENGFFDDLERFFGKLASEKFTGNYDKFQPNFFHDCESFFEWANL